MLSKNGATKDDITKDFSEKGHVGMNTPFLVSKILLMQKDVGNNKCNILNLIKNFPFLLFYLLFC